jgi:hypothetical protein
MYDLFAGYDRSPLVMKAVIFALITLTVGLCLDDLMHLMGLSWLWERLIENLLEAVVIFLVSYSILKSREMRVKKRFQEVGYLNHHIRNALSVIELASTLAGEAEEKLALIGQQSKRIQRCLEKISREEDISKYTDHPLEP